MRIGPTLAAAVAVAALCGMRPAAAEDELVLKFATTDPPMAHLNVQFHHPWAKRITEQGAGKVKVEVYDGGALAGHGNAYERVVNDVAQVSWSMHHTVAGKFPRSSVDALPFLADRSEPATMAYWKLYKSGLLDAEYDQVVPMYVVVFPQMSLHLRKEPKGLDDLKGLRIISSNRIGALCLDALGAAPLTIGMGETYTALQRGTADGMSFQWTGFQPFKLVEVTAFHVDTPLGASSGMVFMNKTRYEALPAAVRKIVDDNSGAEQSRRFGVFWDKVQDGAREDVRKTPGHAIVTLSPKQSEEWRRRLMPIWDQWIKETPDGQKVLDSFRTLLAETTKIAG